VIGPILRHQGRSGQSHRTKQQPKTTLHNDCLSAKMFMSAHTSRDVPGGENRERHTTAQLDVRCLADESWLVRHRTFSPRDFRGAGTDSMRDYSREGAGARASDSGKDF
jgi:hypothetical protein